MSAHRGLRPEPRPDMLDRLARRAAGDRPRWGLRPKHRRAQGWRHGVSRRQAIGTGARATAAAALVGGGLLRFPLAAPAQTRRSCIPCLEQAYKKAQQAGQRCAKLNKRLSDLYDDIEAIRSVLLNKINKGKDTPSKKRIRADLNEQLTKLRQEFAETSDALTDCWEGVDEQLHKDRYACVGLATSSQSSCEPTGGGTGGGGGGGGGPVDPCGCQGADVCCGCIHPEPFKICCIPEYACVCCPQS